MKAVLSLVVAAVAATCGSDAHDLGGANADMEARAPSGLGSADSPDGCEPSVGLGLEPAARPAPHPHPNYPNEPSGFRVIAAAGMEQVFGWPEGSSASDRGRWWHWEREGGSTEILSQPEVPGGPYLNRTRFEAGLRPGTAPMSWGGWDGDPADGGQEYEEMYFSKRIRLVGQNWESHHVGTKLGFFGVGRGPSTARNDLYPFLQGGVRQAFTVRAVQQNIVSRSLRPNRSGGPVVVVGRWHHWEIYMKLNEPDRSNGVFKWWIDGRLVMEYHDVVYRTAEHPTDSSATSGTPRGAAPEDLRRPATTTSTSPTYGSAGERPREAGRKADVMRPSVV